MTDDTIDVEPTGEDSSGTGDAIAAFLAEDDDPGDPEKQGLPRKPQEKPASRQSAPKAEDDEKPEEEPAEDDGEPKAETKPVEKRVYKQKVMGEERELDADQLDAMAKSLGVEPRELLSAASLKRASYEKMREAAEARKQVEQAQALAKRDPVGALKLLGLTPEEFDAYAQKHVYQRFAQEYDPATGQLLTPEQRELSSFRAKEQERAQTEAAQAERVKAEESQRAQAEQERHWVKTIVAHLEKSGDPKSILPRVAAHLGDAVANDVSTDPADLLDDAVGLAWDDVQAEHAKLYDAMPFEALRTRFPGLVDKVRKGLIGEWRAKSGQKTPEKQPEERPRSTGRRALTSSQVLANFISGR